MLVHHVADVQFRYGNSLQVCAHNDVSVNDGPHIRRWSHNIIILYYTIVLQLPVVFSTVSCCTGLYSTSNSLYHIA
jgi:hypothetical protein